MASIAENMAGDRTSARRLLDQAEATTTGLGYLHSTLAVLQARALSGFFEADLDAVRSPPQRERVSPESDRPLRARR